MFSARTIKLCFQHEQQSYVSSTNSKVMFPARTAVMFSARTTKLCFQHEQQNYGFSMNKKVMF